MQSDIRLLELEPTFADEELRTPLKFGAGLVSSVTSLTVRAKVETRRGEVAEGFGNILLSDLWAWPTARLAHAERDAVMREIAVRYCRALSDLAGYEHPLRLALETKQLLLNVTEDLAHERKLPEAVPTLASLVSASPVEAAFNDAFGKANGVCSYDAYGPEFLSSDLGTLLGKEFAGRYVSDYLRDSYQPFLPVFHLVGGVDKLMRSEVEETDPKDGLPVSLEEWIARDGIYCLKVKLRGNDVEWDVARTVAVARVAEESLCKQGRQGLHLSIDSNELCESPEVVLEYLAKLREASPKAYKALAYIEQPTERDLAAHAFDMRPIAKEKPLLADEGVTSVETLTLARELGWSGVALKTCKGHSSQLLYVAWAKEHGMLYTVQDLTNPGLALAHSAGLAARIDPLLGFEYNSRQFLPWSEPGVREKHSPLFTVKEGTVSTETLGALGLGY